MTPIKTAPIQDANPATFESDLSSELEGKTLLAGTVDGYHLRSMLATGILPKLRQKGLRILCITPFPEAECLQPYKKMGIEFVKMSHDRPHVLEWLLLVANATLFRRQVPGQNLIFEKVNISRAKKIVSIVIGKCLNFRWMTRWTARRIAHWPNRREVVEFFDKYTFDLYLSGTPGWKPTELHYLREAKKRGVPTLCQILSWDNLSMKGPFYSPPDKLMLWNEDMKDMAVEDFGMKSENVEVTGAPQFDTYKQQNLSKEEARTQLMTALGIPAQKYDQVIVFAGIPESIAPYQMDSFRHLVQQVHEDLNLDRVALVFRPHPQHILSDEIFEEGVYLNQASSHRPEQSTDNAYRWTPGQDHLDELAMVMRGADLVLTIASSISLDAAAVDTPVINLGYARSKEFDAEVIKSYYYSRHYQKVTHSGAVQIVYSDVDLKKAVDEALRTPERRREKRRKLVEEICGPWEKSASDQQVDVIQRELLQQVK